MAVQKRLAFAGLAVQDAKDAPADRPTYGFGLLSGGWDPGIVQAPDAITMNERVAGESNRDEAKPTASFDTRLYKRLSGLLLYGALGDIDITLGADNVTVLTVGDDLPWLTFYGRYGADYMRMINCKISQLKIAGAGPGLVTASVDIAGGDFDLDEPWEAIYDEKGQPRFRGSGGTFELDVDGSDLASAPIKNYTITINNNAEQIMLAESFTPSDVAPALAEVMCELTTVPSNLADWKAGITGSPAGTTLTDVPVYGSMDLLLEIDSHTKVRMEAAKVDFLAKLPSVDPAGGAAELPLIGHALTPDSGTAFTATVTNDEVYLEES